MSKYETALEVLEEFKDTHFGISTQLVELELWMRIKDVNLTKNNI